MTSHTFIQTKKQQDLYNKATKLSEVAKRNSKEMDEKAQFSLDTLQALKKEKYLSLSLPEKYGGQQISLYEFLLLQEKLAEGDGPTALSVGWHLGVMMELSEGKLWEEEIFSYVAKDIEQNQSLVNRAATEPATGSPTRGGIPETTAKKENDHYIINGRKTFTTMASVLDYFIVTAYIHEKEAVGSFLIAKNTAGVAINKTWDTLGMRGTGSDDLILKNVKVKEMNLVEVNSKPKRPEPKGWLLHIPACYLGIAIAARNEAVEFAKNFQPNSLKTPISEVDHIRQKVGEMDLKLMQARYFMYAVAEKWDKHPENRSELGSELAAVKVVATNTANEVVDLAMRIAGGRGLSKEMPFEKLYRDVRAGLHNPPMDDMVIQMLAGKAFN
ncbi:acyl-CoA dehydrogenase family protein [Saliterribacillus persicus]|uniref:Alkylation response protein AidB-like acyl-CoA dehydrogenase n=1 Tax=Saliterribacillus persicus TaxID=930114 RepID=A0A368XG68_9BACI|nr:acyl-CoA dehydrogenase family protein [Saliterribacillus persicus]RCW66991.1 alkylation response protein AidB-like acyl-CoA dehydrogenase [Saliterribacillus persicus]